MIKFEGYLFGKLANINTRSEGPVYYLQLWNEEEIEIHKKTHLWMPDQVLHEYIAQKIILFGEIPSDQKIRYEAIEPLTRDK